jgi:hypothetical protein
MSRVANIIDNGIAMGATTRAALPACASKTDRRKGTGPASTIGAWSSKGISKACGAFRPVEGRSLG